MKKVALLVLLPLLIAGCQTIQDIASSIQKPSLSVSDVHITGFNFQEMELTYDIKIDNPNPVAIRMLGYDYDLNISDHSFLKGNQTEGVNIEASGGSIFQVPMSVDFNKLYNTIKVLAGKDQSSYLFLSHLTFALPVLGCPEL